MWRLWWGRCRLQCSTWSARRAWSWRWFQIKGAVQQFSADGADPPLGMGVGDRGPHRGADDLGATGREDLVEAGGGLVSET